MVYKLANEKDMDALPILFIDTWAVVHAYVKALSTHYGADRNVDNDDGGYVLFAAPGTSLEEIKEVFDYTKCQVEYVTLHRYTEPLICSAHYILHNEFTVTLVMALQDLPTEYLKELEGDTLL